MQMRLDSKWGPSGLGKNGSISLSNVIKWQSKIFLPELQQVVLWNGPKQASWMLGGIAMEEKLCRQHLRSGSVVFLMARRVTTVGLALAEAHSILNKKISPLVLVGVCELQRGCACICVCVLMGVFVCVRASKREKEYACVLLRGHPTNILQKARS